MVWLINHIFLKNMAKKSMADNNFILEEYRIEVAVILFLVIFIYMTERKWYTKIKFMDKTKKYKQQLLLSI